MEVRAITVATPAWQLPPGDWLWALSKRSTLVQTDCSIDLLHVEVAGGQMQGDCDQLTVLTLANMKQPYTFNAPVLVSS